jgi:CRP-like cAMP-binding protein
LPDLARAVPNIDLFSNLNDEQIPNLAQVCNLRKFNAGEHIFQQNEMAESAYIILDGSVQIQSHEGQLIGVVKEGECLGEIALLTGRKHALDAIAKTKVSSAEIPHYALQTLVNRRPDIGTIIYRNLAVGLGEKLKRADESISG